MFNTTHMIWMSSNWPTTWSEWLQHDYDSHVQLDSHDLNESWCKSSNMWVMSWVMLTFSAFQQISKVCCKFNMTNETHVSAVCCSVLQCVAVCCSVLQCVAVCGKFNMTNEIWVSRVLSGNLSGCNTLQLTATHCNTLQHTATHCNTLHHNVTYCITSRQITDTLQHTVTRCNTLQHSATLCMTILTN